MSQYQGREAEYGQRSINKSANLGLANSLMAVKIYRKNPSVYIGEIMWRVIPGL